MADYKIYTDTIDISDGTITLDIEGDLEDRQIVVVGCKEGAFNAQYLFTTGGSYGENDIHERGDYTLPGKVRGVKITATEDNTTYYVKSGLSVVNFLSNNVRLLDKSIDDITVAGIIEITQPVQLYETFSIIANKINYTVPNGKIFKIIGWTATSEGSKHQIEFQDDGVGFDAALVESGGSSFASRSIDPQTPIHIASAGSVIRASKISGSVGSPWAVSIQGYLEDV